MTSELYLTACESPDEIVDNPTTSPSHDISPKKSQHQDTMQLMSKLRVSYNEVIEVPRAREKVISFYYHIITI